MDKIERQIGDPLGPMPKEWAPTNCLRFVGRRTSHVEAQRDGTMRILQQMWRCRNTGATEWRDVPMENE